MTRTASFCIAACALLAAPFAAADKLGDHPAVVAKRVHAQAPYDYASKFYPHPAWLYLSTPAPDDTIDGAQLAVRQRVGRQRETTADRLIAAQRAAHIDSQPDVR